MLAVKNNNIHYSKYVDNTAESFVYVLICPIKGELFYIGKANNPNKRFRGHFTKLSPSLKNNYIKWLISRGQKPRMLIVFGGSETDSLQTEKKLIAIYSKSPFIKNMTPGGDGGNTMGGRALTKEQCKKISASKVGKPRDLSYINNLKRKPVIQIDPKTNLPIKEFISVNEASALTGCSKTNIAKMARGKIKKSIKLVGGFKWVYKSINYETTTK